MKKIIGIFVCTLLIATVVLPVAWSVNVGGIKRVKNTVSQVESATNIIYKNQKQDMSLSFSIQPILSAEEYVEKQNDAYKETMSSLGWCWKPSYPNYAPSGMPDFDQKQDNWKSIVDGGNGIAETNKIGDDIQVVPVETQINPGDIIVASGSNCKLDTQAAGDDVAVWAFCGPVAVANCFWWFDSKYGWSKGKPGDGLDGFPLVQDYRVGDDHKKENVPKLIEKLAAKMGLCSKGTCDIDDMQDAIDEWFADTDLNDVFVENTYNKTSFSFIENEIKRSQDVILLLGFYDVDGAECMRKGFNYVTCAGVNSDGFMIAFSDPALDIANPSGPDHNDAQYVSHDIYDVIIGCPCPDLGYKWWLPDYPSCHDYTIVEQAVVICPKPIYVEKKVWDGDKWVESVDVMQGDIVRFNITVRNNYQTYLTNIVVADTLPRCLGYVSGNAEPEEPWINDNNLVWTFLEPLEQDEKICILFDAKAVRPGENIINYVKVDAYPTGGSPVSDTDTATVNVEAVLTPNLHCDGSLSWTTVRPGSTISGEFIVSNVGDPGSLLDWEISESPDWGTWTFNPSSGTDLKPEDGLVTIQVSVVAPDEKNQHYSGNIKVVNSEDSSDYGIIQVSLTTPKTKAINLLFQNFLNNHPYLFPILQRLLLRLGLQ